MENDGSTSAQRVACMSAMCISPSRFPPGSPSGRPPPLRKATTATTGHSFSKCRCRGFAGQSESYLAHLLQNPKPSSNSGNKLKAGRLLQDLTAEFDLGSPFHLAWHGIAESADCRNPHETSSDTSQCNWRKVWEASIPRRGKLFEELWPGQPPAGSCTGPPLSLCKA